MSKERLCRTITWSTLAAVGAAGLVGGCSGEEAAPKPQLCTSPAKLSPVYEGDKNQNVTNEYRTWRWGVMAFILNPPEGQGYEGTVVSFKNPDDPKALWHTSYPMGKNDSSENVVQFGVGPGNVQLKTEFKAIAGTAICSLTPSVVYSDFIPLTSIVGTKPEWPPQTASASPAPS